MYICCMDYCITIRTSYSLIVLPAPERIPQSNSVAYFRRGFPGLGPLPRRKKKFKKIINDLHCRPFKEH